MAKTAEKLAAEQDPLAKFGLSITQFTRPTLTRLPEEGPKAAKENILKGIDNQIARVEAFIADPALTEFKIDDKAVRKAYHRDGGVYFIELRYGTASLLGKDAATGKPNGIPAGKTLEEVKDTLGRIKQAVAADVFAQQIDAAYKEVSATSQKARDAFKAGGRKPKDKAA